MDSMFKVIAQSRRFMSDQQGGAYSVSVLLILPIYIASIAFAIELIFALNAELSFTASKGAAEHAVRCWYPHRESIGGGVVALESEVQRAVVRSMVPFAPVGKPQEQRDPEGDLALVASGLSTKAVERYGAKAAALNGLIDVEITPVEQPVSGFDVNLRYEAPLYFGFFSPIFANETGEMGPVRVHETRIFVPASAQQVHRESLGISYSPREAMQW